MSDEHALAVCLIDSKVWHILNPFCVRLLHRHFCTESDKLQTTNSVSHLNMSRYGQFFIANIKMSEIVHVKMLIGH